MTAGVFTLYIGKSMHVKRVVKTYLCKLWVTKLQNVQTTIVSKILIIFKDLL